MEFVLIAAVDGVVDEDRMVCVVEVVDENEVDCKGVASGVLACVIRISHRRSDDLRIILHVAWRSMITWWFSGATFSHKFFRFCLFVFGF